MGNLSQDGNTDVVSFQVENHAEYASRELQQFHGHRIFHAVNPGNTVSHRQDRSYFAYVQFLLIVSDLFGDDVAYFFCPDFLHALYFLP